MLIAVHNEMTVPLDLWISGYSDDMGVEKNNFRVLTVFREKMLVIIFLGS